MSYHQNWNSFDIINKTVLSRLIECGFTTPTEVQQQVIKSYKQHQDFLIASQTVMTIGSGKTLAFGIPIISDLLTLRESQTKRDHQLSCLILTPTRELAVQIMEHLKPIVGKDLLLGCLIGGMSKQKQERILNNKPNILVATPGRLWEFIEQDQVDCLKKLNQISYLVLDEADRMVELGHFEHVDKIIQKIVAPREIVYDRQLINAIMKKKPKFDEMQPDQLVEMDYDQFLKLSKGETKQIVAQDDNSDQEENISQQEDQEEQQIQENFDGQWDNQRVPENKKLKTFFLSATLTQQFTRGTKYKYLKGKENPNELTSMIPKLQSILGKLKVTSKPKIIDLTQSVIFPEGLQFFQTHCEEDDKLLFLAHFVQEHIEETFIVFLNSISYGKKVASLLDVLGISSVCLHSMQQQRQRLKRLEKFTKRQVKVLVCTDIAARGIDIKNVENVIHYQIPFNVDTFVHRCGRTARIGKNGKTLCLVGPKDIISFSRLESEILKTGIAINQQGTLRQNTFLKYDFEENQISGAFKVEKEKHLLDKKIRQKDSMEQQLKNEFYDDDDEDLKKEIEEIDQEILAKKRLLSHHQDKYKKVVSQKLQPEQRQGTKKRRNALFFTPDQIDGFQRKIEVLNQKALEQAEKKQQQKQQQKQGQSMSKKQKINLKQQRKFKQRR